MADESPVVSIITPAFNAERFLPETIASVRGQSFTDWEWIVADDGSEDGTLAVLRACAAEDPRVNVLQLPRAGRPSVARNAAWQAARGRWIAFQDADDVWLPGHLEAMLRTLEREGRRWGFANLEFFGDGSGRWYPADFIPPRPMFHHALCVEGLPLITLVAERALLAECCNAGPDRLFDEAELIEDLDLVLRLSLRDEPAYVPEVLARYRLHTGGISKSGDRDFARQMALIEKWRGMGTPEPLCRRAERLQRSKHAAGRLHAGREGWRAGMLGALGNGIREPRNLFFALLAILPAPAARWAYQQALSARRRR